MVNYYLKVNIKISQIQCYNKKCNGKIKIYYDNGNLKFEGDYQPNGKGKEYYDNGSIKFEGEYKNNINWSGKGYDINKNIIYEINNGSGKTRESMIMVN